MKQDNLLIWMDEKFEDPAILEMYTKPVGFIQTEGKNEEEQLEGEQKAIKFYGLKPSMQYTPLTV